MEQRDDLLPNTCKRSCKSSEFTSLGPPVTLGLVLIRSAFGSLICASAGESSVVSEVKSIRHHRFDLDSLGRCVFTGGAGGPNIS